MRQYFSNVLKWGTQSDDMKGEIYYWLYSFEKFHQRCIIIPTESYNYFVPEDSIYIAVITPQVSIIKKTKQDILSMQPTNCYTTMLFLVKLILSINFHTMMTCIDKDNQHFSYHNYDSMIVKYLQNICGEMYLGGLKTFLMMFSIVKNISINFHMDADELDGFLYNTLSEKIYKTQRINIKIVKIILLYLIIFLRILELKLEKNYMSFL